MKCCEGMGYLDDVDDPVVVCSVEVVHSHLVCSVEGSLVVFGNGNGFQLGGDDRAFWEGGGPGGGGGFGSRKCPWFIDSSSLLRAPLRC
jgi:hypothetical protein